MAAGARLSLIDGKIQIINISEDDSEFEFTADNNGALESGGTPASGFIPKFKVIDQSLPSSTVMQNDTKLFHDIPLNETWSFNGFLYCSEAGTNPNIKIRMGAVNGLVGSIEYMYATPTENDVLSDFTTESFNISLTGTKQYIQIAGCMTATTAGRLNVQWAQATSDTDPTIVHAKSFMNFTKMG